MIAITEKKLVIRKAPIEKAGTYDVGFVAKGSDDIDYVVVADKKNFKRWMKVKKETPTPKRVYTKKPKIEEETPQPNVEMPDKTQVVEVPEPKIKRTCKKKPVFVEQGTQTDDVMCTPPKIKKERKIPDTPRKK